MTAPALNFTRAEYDARLTKTRTAMARAGIELLIVTDPSNMHWLTGYDGWSFYVHQCVLVPAAGEPLEGMEAGLAAAKPGNVCEDIASAFFAVLRKYGIVKDNRTGYSIGLSYPPDWGERSMSLRPGDRTELQPGMTFHFMTGLWLETMGLEITESIAITETGVECLANVPRRLFVKP